ncbi:hypothetical protein D3C83_72850 [compost metagenome]
MGTALALGRNCVGIDTLPDYCDAARAKLSNVQLELLADEPTGKRRRSPGSLRLDIGG